MSSEQEERPNEKYIEQTSKKDKRVYFFSIIIRNLMKAFWLFSVQNKKIMCIASGGRYYFDSQKYISEYLLSNYPGEFRIYSLLKDPKSFHREGVSFIKPYTVQHFFHFCTAKIIISNGGMPAYLPKRKTQYCINTWHGGGAYKNTFGTFDKQRKEFRYRAKINCYKNKCIDVFTSSCRAFSELVIPDMTNGYDGEILSCGMPRNDMLFQNSDPIRKEVCETLNIDRDKILILYAPTFRGVTNTFKSGSNTTHGWNIDARAVCEAVEKRFGRQPIFLFRKHPLDSSGNLSGVVNVNTYSDMQKLLSAIDILISDYSSSIWDYSLTNKPCFLYVPDMDYYLNCDRGVYTPIETWPGIMARTNEELTEAILSFDETAYQKKVDMHHELLGSYETGTACKQVCERIVQVCNV